MSVPVVGARRRKSSRHGERLLYAGVALELLVDFEGWELGEEYRRFALPGDAVAPEVAQVQCAVAPDPSLDRTDEEGRRVSLRVTGELVEVESGLVRCAARALGGGRYAATARVHPDGNGVSALVSGLSAALVYHGGGLVLHATTVVVDGLAVLFIGPSGAGKTTAARQAAGATWLTKDRAAVFFHEGRPVVWGMAGGDEVGLPRAEGRCYPVGAVLRPRRAGEPFRPRLLGPAEALLVLREAVQSGARDAATEASVLDAALRLADAVPVGVVHAALGRDLTPALSHLLASQGAP